MNVVQSIIRWIQTPLAPKQRLPFIGKMLLLKIIYSVSLVILLNTSTKPFLKDVYDTFRESLESHSGSAFIWLMLPALALIACTVLIEECVYRLIPLGLILYFTKRRQVMTIPIVCSALISSALFGLGHGYLVSLAFQGVGGLIISVTFLKAGGLERKYWQAFKASTILHFSYNLVFSGVGLCWILLHGRT